MILSISEEKNRGLKITQEKTQLLHQLHRAESDLVSAKAEIKRTTEEITLQREKVKQFHTAKIGADKRVAEVSAMNSRIEVRNLVCVCIMCVYMLLYCMNSVVTVCIV